MTHEELLNIKSGVYRLEKSFENPMVDNRVRADWRFRKVIVAGTYTIALHEDTDTFKDKTVTLRDITIQRKGYTQYIKAHVSYDDNGDQRISLGTPKQEQLFTQLVERLVPETELTKILDATEAFDLRMALHMLVQEGKVSEQDVLDQLP